MTVAYSGIAAPSETVFPSERGVRFAGFAWRDGKLEVVKTGVRLTVDGRLWAEAAHWAVYLVVLIVAVMVARMRGGASARVWYAPDRAGPWYLLRGAALWAGLRDAPSPDQADIAVYFDDSTRGTPPRLPGLSVVNGGCGDISKSRVGRVFAEVFGYPIAVDPERAIGSIVEKSDRNGVHDGRIVTAPLTPREGLVYERLVDTTGADGMVHDLRTPCVGGRPVVVWDKTKPAADRFAIHNRRAVLREPAAVFSAAEIELIARFNGRMGLDWGGLDILRDRADGRIYIVDVNKTDLGPVIALSWADKIRSMNRLSRALSQMVATMRGATPMAAAAPRRASAWAPPLTLGAAVALMLAWAWLRPQNQALAALSGHAVALRILAHAHPALSVAAFVLAYATAVTIMLPVALIMTFAGGYLLGAAGGGLGSIAGATLGAVAAYGLTRLAPATTPHRLEARFPRLRNLRADFVDHPFRYVLSMRLMPLTPFTLVSLAAGLNRIGLAPLVLGTALGVAPECIVYAAVGSGLAGGAVGRGGFPIAVIGQPLVWGGMAVLTLLAWLAMRWGRGSEA